MCLKIRTCLHVGRIHAILWGLSIIHRMILLGPGKEIMSAQRLPQNMFTEQRRFICYRTRDKSQRQERKDKGGGKRNKENGKDFCPRKIKDIL